MRIIKRLQSAIKTAAMVARHRATPLEKRPGTLFIGYAEGDLGLGQSFRSNVVAALQAGIRLAIYPFNVGIETRRIDPFMADYYDTSHAYKINIIEVAPDQTPIVFQNIDPRITRNSYNILRTFWELPQAPQAWRPMLAGIDEIWAPNRFVADALREVFPGKITIISPTVDTDDGPFEGRSAFGLDPDRFYFLFSFDYFSSPYRKNPQATLQAFQDAFANGADRVGLIIKAIGATEHFSEIKAVFQEAAKRDQRIILIERTLKRAEMLNLIYSCDCYVSLHRSEGFGAGMAEAMSLGKPVIGTNFSGNTEFLTKDNGFPVPYTLRPVEPHEYNWSTNQVWAEPDVGAAAATMCLVVEKPELRKQRALSGQAFVKAKYWPATVGQTMKNRISDIEYQSRRWKFWGRHYAS